MPVFHVRGLMGVRTFEKENMTNTARSEGEVKRKLAPDDSPDLVARATNTHVVQSADEYRAP